MPLKKYMKYVLLIISSTYNTVHDFVMHLHLLQFASGSKLQTLENKLHFLNLFFLMELTQSFGAGNKLAMLSSIVWKCTEIHYLHLNIWRPSMWFLCPFFKSVQCDSIRKYRDIHTQETVVWEEKSPGLYHLHTEPQEYNKIQEYDRVQTLFWFRIQDISTISIT